MAKKFNKLEKKIENEYRHKGVPLKEARYIGKATTVKVYREKKGY